MDSGKQLFQNIYINNLTEKEAIDQVCSWVEHGERNYVVYVNSDVMVKIDKDPQLREVALNAGLVLPDGKPLVWISRFYGQPFKERVAGSDMVLNLCRMAAEKGYTIFFLGGAEGIPEKAVENLHTKLPNLKIAGTYSPPLGFENDEKEVADIRNRISQAHPDLLICSFGCPKQEKFIYNNRDFYDATVSICAGATIDFLAGNVKRCPEWMKNAGLEWFYRFLQEPRRLFKRYFIDDMYIFWMALKYHPKKTKKQMTDKNRILMCCSDLETVKGGMVTVVKNYLECKEYWKKSDITYIPTHIEGGKKDKILYFAKAWYKVTRQMSAGKADVLYLHVAERGSVIRKAILLYMAKLFRVPVLLHHHGAEFDQTYEQMGKVKQGFVRRFLKAADLNVVLSESRRQALLEKEPNAKVTVLHNAVRVEKESSYSPKRRRIVTMGRLGQRKGTWDILEVLRQINSELPEDVEVWLCGDGEVEKAKQLVKEYGLEKRIRHVGWIDGQQKADCMRECMLHVLPSYHEVLPMSILETMACGIPNISTRIASIPEVIEDGENGFLINPGDREQLGERILRLVQDEALRMKISEQAYLTVAEKFSLEGNIGKLEKFCMDLSKKRKDL